MFVTSCMDCGNTCCKVVKKKLTKEKYQNPPMTFLNEKLDQCSKKHQQEELIIVFLFCFVWLFALYFHTNVFMMMKWYICMCENCLVEWGVHHVANKLLQRKKKVFGSLVHVLPIQLFVQNTLICLRIVVCSETP